MATRDVTTCDECHDPEKIKTPENEKYWSKGYAREDGSLLILPFSEHFPFDDEECCAVVDLCSSKCAGDWVGHGVVSRG